MGPELGGQFNLLYNDILSITLKFHEYKFLYVEKESRVDLMHNTAPLFFFYLRNLLWQNILLGIARITDKPLTAGKLNITLNNLPSLVEDKSLCDELQILIEKLIVVAAAGRALGKIKKL